MNNSSPTQMKSQTVLRSPFRTFIITLLLRERAHQGDSDEILSCTEERDGSKTFWTERELNRHYAHSGEWDWKKVQKATGTEHFNSAHVSAMQYLTINRVRLLIQALSPEEAKANAKQLAMHFLRAKKSHRKAA